MGLLDLFRNAPTTQASVETGSLRDAYMQYLEQAAYQGIQPVPIDQFAKMLQEQQRQQQLQQLQQQQQVPQPGLMNLRR